MVENKKQQRVVAYIPQEDARQLKAKLALNGESFASWLRKVIRDYIKS